MQIRTRLLSSLLACASSLVMVRAQSQLAPPKPSPEVRKLAVMVGRFTNEGEVKAGAFGPNSPALKVSGTDECKWIADGFGVLCIETVDIGEPAAQRNQSRADIVARTGALWPDHPDPVRKQSRVQTRAAHDLAPDRESK